MHTVSFHTVSSKQACREIAPVGTQQHVQVLMAGVVACACTANQAASRAVYVLATHAHVHRTALCPLPLTAGDKQDLVAKQGTWNRNKGRKVGARSMAQASGATGYVYNEWSSGAAGSKPLLSGPQGAVALQERAARNKKIRQQLGS